MNLILKRNDQELLRHSLDDLPPQFHIGRGSDSEWRVPRDCKRVSSTHARVDIRKKKVSLTDANSSNGVLINGKRIRGKAKLSPGQHAKIGDCTLHLEASGTTSAQAVRDPSLLQLGGAQRDKRHFVTQQLTRIGSDPLDDDLVLEDRLISRDHASIERKEGACWLVDRGSANGTSVNGENLPAGTERMLRHGDHVSIAHLEFRFHDGVQAEKASSPLTRLLVMGFTLLLLSALYFAYQHVVLSPAPILTEEIEEDLLDGNYASAKEKLDEVVHRPGAAENRDAIDDLRDEVETVEAIQKQWHTAQALLVATNLADASTSFGSLASTDISSWNDRLHEERSVMELGKDLLDLHNQTLSSLKRDDLKPDDLNALLGQLRAAPRDKAKGHDFYTPLLTQLDGLEAQVQTIASEFAAFDTILREGSVLFLETGEATRPDFAKVLRKAEHFRQRCSPSVRTDVDQLLPTLRKMATAYGNIVTMSKAFTHLEFEMALAVELNPPSQSECSSDPRLSASRKTLMELFEMTRAEVEDIQYHLLSIQDALPEGTSLDELLDSWTDPDVLRALLACDCYNQPIPRLTREEPSSTYDRMLGVKRFYRSLKDLPNPPTFNTGRDAGFDPELVRTQRVLEGVDRFVKHVHANPWMRLHRLGEETAKCEDLLRRRDQLQSGLIQRMANSRTRDQLILGGIALCLSPNDSPEYKGTSLAMYLPEQLDILHKEILKSHSAYRRASSSEKLRIRDDILSKALPGEHLARPHWVNRLAGRKLQ